jgi:hypothetical protein
MFSQLSSKIRDGRKGILGFTVFVFLMAAAMEFSDGILTPAISVISAVEGIKTVNPELEYLVVPITVVILAALFIFQFKGTHRLGKVFGPVMVVWFLTISDTSVADRFALVGSDWRESRFRSVTLDRAPSFCATQAPSETASSGWFRRVFPRFCCC